VCKRERELFRSVPVSKVGGVIDRTDRSSAVEDVSDAVLLKEIFVLGDGLAA